MSDLVTIDWSKAGKKTLDLEETEEKGCPSIVIHAIELMQGSSYFGRVTNIIVTQETTREETEDWISLTATGRRAITIVFDKEEENEQTNNS